TALAARIGLDALGVLTGDRVLGQGAALGATLALSSFSREQESEADMLGIRYMTRLGYDPMAIATFLRSLEGESALRAKLAGRPGGADRFSLFSTHPRTAERVAEAVGLARAQMASAADLRLGAVEYLSLIDGMYYGGDPENGFVKGRLFIHPKMGFRFQVPPGFQLFNGRSRIVAIGPDRARIIFDAAPKPVSGSMAHYLQSVWTPGVRLAAVETIDVNGLEGATGAARVSTQKGPVDLRLLAIRRDPNTIYRFAFLTPPKLSGALSEELRRTTYSFRVLTEREARALRPLRIRVEAVEPGDSVESLAARMRFEDHRLARFRTLNGLAPGQPLRVGQLVKLVVEE
ncbi:MAG: M48 family metalloprotease, partial [Alphaproteobacteria bacterium]